MFFKKLFFLIFFSNLVFLHSVAYHIYPDGNVLVNYFLNFSNPVSLVKTNIQEMNVDIQPFNFFTSSHDQNLTINFFEKQRQINISFKTYMLTSKIYEKWTFSGRQDFLNQSIEQSVFLPTNYEILQCTPNCSFSSNKEYIIAKTFSKQPIFLVYKPKSNTNQKKAKFDFMPLFLLILFLLLILILFLFKKKIFIRKKPETLPGLLENEKQIYLLVKQNPGITQKKLSSSVSFPKSTVSRIIRRLRNRDIFIVKKYGMTNKIYLKINGQEEI